VSDSTLGGTADPIAACLKVLVEPGSTVEMRVLNASGGPHIRHYSSEDLLTMARDAVRFSKDAQGVYWLLNPLPAEWCGSPAKDMDIVRRRWLLIDCDPKRKGTVSSTDAEKDAARATMVMVDAFLGEQGWPAPIIGDSGNGFHLLYLIDLPADDGGLVHRVLNVLASLFDNEAASIDTKVANASRICKLYGTLAGKGPNTSDRPHRLSKIITIPEQLDVVPVAMLVRLASEGDVHQDATGQPVPRPPAAADRDSYPAAIERAAKYLGEMDASIAGANGSNRLIKAASVLVNDFGLADGEAFCLLMTEFNPRCQPPWSDAEVRHKIEDSRKNPPHRPAKGQGAAGPIGRSSSNFRTNGQPQNTTTEAIVVRLSDVQEREVEWLWPNRIPLGKLTLLAGDPGLGKSFVMVDMAARVSTGTGWPDCYDQPQPVGSVIMFNCEDDIADTVLPRLKRAGGDPSKVIALQGIATIDGESGERRQRGFSFDVDLPKLIEVLEVNSDVRLVVIDPVSAYCGATDSHKNADIRAMLAPLSDMASQYRVAVVMVTHLAKGSGGKAVYRAMGSLAFAAAARAVWYVAKDHDDDKRRLILLTKINIAVEAAGLAYRLQDGAVCWAETPVVMTADEHLAKETRPERKPRGSSEQGEAVQQAADWLVEKLTGCSMHSKVVKQLADDADIAPATLKRAKKLAKVKSLRSGFGEKSVVWWSLSSNDDEPVPTDVDEAEAARLFP
jgi:hypothetical protein